MKRFSVKTLADILQAGTDGITDGSFNRISIDSRTIKQGGCFFAIVGENFDGHDFVNKAFEKGAICVVVNKDKEIDCGNCCVLKVDDTIESLGLFAKEYRRNAGYKIVAITGSVGKTTTREIIYHVLSKHFNVFQSQGNFNNNIGLPLTLLDATPETEIVIAELGSNHPGEIRYLTKIAQPDIALITNTRAAHLEGFGDLETIIQEKLSIAEGLNSKGRLVINADCQPLLQACRDRNISFDSFGITGNSCSEIENLRHTESGSCFSLNGTKIDLPLPGPGNVENALAAWAVCRQFGINVNDFANAIRNLPAVSMRCELLQIGTLTVLNDCYNANPASMKNALQILANLGVSKGSRTVFICGDMAELGKQSTQLHAELGTEIAEAGVQLVLGVGALAEIAAESAKSCAKYDLQTESFKNTLSLCNNLDKFIKDNDIVLVKGSRIAKLETTIDNLSRLFN